MCWTAAFTFAILVLAITCNCAVSFLVHRSEATAIQPLQPLHMTVDPVGIIASVVDIDLGVALASAAVGAVSGAVSQIPKISELERELMIAKAELAEKEVELANRVQELEDKLFLMDQEFEGQTAKFKRLYDRSARKELERVTEKLKADLDFKYQIRLEQERSKMLGGQLHYENDRIGRSKDLVQLNLEKSRLATVNENLQKTLCETESELERMRKEVEEINKRFGFFGLFRK